MYKKFHISRSWNCLTSALSLYYLPNVYISCVQYILRIHSTVQYVHLYSIEQYNCQELLNLCSFLFLLSLWCPVTLTWQVDRGHSLKEILNKTSVCHYNNIQQAGSFFFPSQWCPVTIILNKTLSAIIIIYSRVGHFSFLPNGVQLP